MKKTVRGIVTLAAALLLFYRLGSILEADYDGNRSMHGFYAMEENTADVIFYGSSHVYTGVNVVDLWDNYGISAFNHAGTMQTLWNSYYNMEESLKYQSPEVMVVDVCCAQIEEEYSGSVNVIKNADSMRFSWNKVKNIWHSVPHDEFLTYILSYPLTHDSYRQLQRGNYERGGVSVLGGAYYKGFRTSISATVFESLPMVDAETEAKAPSFKNREYLQKMVDLAQREQIQLAFIVAPYEGISAEDEAIFCWVEDFARENGVFFLDGNRYYAEMGFDPATDFMEASHLNYSGSVKFTAYLGAWLEENFTLEDHRGDGLYQSWQEYSDCYAAYFHDAELRSCIDAESYLDKLKEYEDCEILIALDDNFYNNPYMGGLERWLGVDVSVFDSSAAIVVEENAAVYCTPNEPEYLWNMETDCADIVIVRKYGESMDILVNNEKLNDSSNDVTIVIYDKKLEQVADTAAFNSDGIIIR